MRLLGVFCIAILALFSVSLWAANTSNYLEISEIKADANGLGVYFANGEEHQCIGGLKTSFFVPDEGPKIAFVINAFNNKMPVSLRYDCNERGYPVVNLIRLKAVAETNSNTDVLAKLDELIGEEEVNCPDSLSLSRNPCVEKEGKGIALMNQRLVRVESKVNASNSSVTTTFKWKGVSSQEESCSSSNVCSTKGTIADENDNICRNTNGGYANFVEAKPVQVYINGIDDAEGEPPIRSTRTYYYCGDSYLAQCRCET